MNYRQHASQPNRQVNFSEQLRKYSVPRYLRYDGDNLTIRFAYDTALHFLSNGTKHATGNTITICSRRANTIG